MNEAKAALKYQLPYSDKVIILEKYSQNKGAITSYKLRLDHPLTQKAIDYELGLLRFSPNVDPYEKSGVRVKQRTKSAPKKRGKESLAISKKTVLSKRSNLYPESINIAIKERSKLWNNREKIGRELVDFADVWPHTRRAANIAEQKMLHKLINSYSYFINKWKESGELDFSIIQNPEPVEKEVKQELLKRWQILSRRVSRARTRAKEADKIKDSHKVQYWQSVEKDMIVEQNRIGLLIGKTRRNEYTDRVIKQG